VLIVVILFWASLAALVWTHLAYPAAVALLARIAERRVHSADAEPTVAVVIAAYNEEAVIARRIENLLALDYPDDRRQILVVSDGSTDHTIAALRPYLNRIEIVLQPNLADLPSFDDVQPTSTR